MRPPPPDSNFGGAVALPGSTPAATMKSTENGSARRASFDSGVKKAVSTIPSGPNKRSCRTSLSRAPSTISTIRPSTSVDVLYSQTSPG